MAAVDKAGARSRSASKRIRAKTLRGDQRAARNQNAKKDDPANFLSVYFREMSDLDVLEPKEEFARAEAIESLEIEIWKRVLSYPSLTDYLLRRVEAALAETPSFRSVRRAATIARKSPTKENLSRVGKAIDRIGVELRSADQDRIVLEESIEHLRELARAGGKIGAVSLTSRKFANYLAGVGAAQRRAQSARNDFVKANLRLVVSIARRFNHGRMPLADLIQEGNIGLMKAVERYDYRKGFRFSTYASWWIRHAISRALADKGREVRLPVHMIDAHHRITKAKRELTAKLLRPPTSEEIAEATDMRVSKVEKLRTYLLDNSLSLDKPVNDEDGRTLGEILEDPDTLDDALVHQLTVKKQASRVRVILDGLKPIEADILRQRFGLDDDEERTLKEIGLKYNLSRERIRQLQEQALGKMRVAMAGP